MNKIQPALKWFGGKNRMAGIIHKLAPPTIISNPANGYIHRVYGYGGGMGEGYDWDFEGVSELFNDINQQLTNFWRVLQDSKTFAKFKRIVEAIPFSRSEFNRCTAIEHPRIVENQPNVQEAVFFFVRCRLSRSGGMKSFAPISRKRTRRGRNEQASAWQSTIRGLDEVHNRLMRIAIECIDAEELIVREDTPRTLFYLDPTYLPDVVSTSDAYEYTMTENQHETMLDIVTQVQGKVMLSGYKTDLYNSRLKNWNREDTSVTNSMASGLHKGRRIESIYMNY